MKRRPAETGGVAGAIALLVTRLFGVSDPDVLVAIGIVAGVVPAFVTGLVAHGGIVGLVKAVVFGKRKGRR